MTNRKIILFLSTLLITLSGAACSDSEDNTTISTPQEKHPLNTFAVKVNNSYYHAKIDQEAHTITIGSIEDTNTIIDVDYGLKDGNTTISPEPTSYLGSWEKEQTVTVKTEDQKETTYTIVFPKFNQELVETIFRDDFDVDGIPDETKWSAVPKGGSNWNDEMSGSYDQAYVSNGNLVLIADKINGVYKAGGIQTLNKFAFTFGKIQVRARITKYPNGAFPAIWLMPQKEIYNGWPFGGEIDIMEHVKQESVIYHTIHTNYTYHLNIKNPPSSKTIRCNYSDYVIYGMEWTEDEISFYVNGQKTFTYPNLKLVDEAKKMQWPFTKDSSFYIILNMGLGNNAEPGSWVGAIDDKNLPAIMEIDWIKVSKPNKK